MHTIDGGATWNEDHTEGLPKGDGQFCTWGEVNSINAMDLYPRNGGEDRQIEMWLATSTGLFYTKDAGKAWKRSAQSGEFFNLVQIEDFRKIYVVGWPGISHGSGDGDDAAMSQNSLLCAH